MTTRRDVHTGFVAAGLEAAVVLEPRPLDSQDALALIDTDDSPLPPHVVATLAERAGGNPLFLGELLAAARSVGVDALPDTLEALLANQIDRLGTRDRAVLRVASVLGASFSPDVLAASLDASGYQPRRRDLAAPGRFRSCR